MWRRVEINNFRSLEHVCVDLAPLTLVVGPNGSGKSNFADALVFARDIALDASMAVQNRGGIASLRRWSVNGATEVSMEVRAATSQSGLEDDYTRHQFTLTSGPEGNWYFSRELIEIVQSGDCFFRIERNGDKVVLKDAPGPKSLVPDELRPDISAMFFARQMEHRFRGLIHVRRFRLNTNAMRQPQIATERTSLDETASNIAVAVQHLKKTPARWDTVLRAMAQIVPGLQEIEVDTLGRYLVLKFVQGQVEGGFSGFAAADMSEGSIRALGLLVASQQMSRDELLIIEEPEVSIHPGAAQLLFEVLKSASAGGAILLTTHSPDLLDAAHDEEILITEYRGGITSVGAMAKAQRALVKDGLFTVAELLRSEPLRIEGSEPLAAGSGTSEP